MKLEELKEASAEETSMGDFIISKFEAEKISYKQAKEELLKNDLGVYIQELNAAADLKKDDIRKHNARKDVSGIQDRGGYETTSWPKDKKKMH